MPVTATPPAVLLLRPGIPVVRRDADTLQVGLHPPLAACLPDRPEVRDLLATLRDGATVPSPGSLAPEAAHALAALRAADLVLTGAPAPGRPDLTAARAQFGSDGSRRLAARSRHTIGVRGATACRSLAASLAASAGLVVDDGAPAVWLVVETGQVSRDTLDPLVRAGVPHLVVSGDAAGRRVGPFVEPGRTACLRCVDAHEAESDPRRPFLLEQAARSGGVSPVDPVLDQLALAWAVRDLSRYLEGDEPSTWSATVDIGPGSAPRVMQWLRHPHCGCAWDLLLDLA
ncbi:hypothetical protein F0U44_01365 [Nocardioides humilatus]|uniref:Bacteriocin biosynthesis cyclodehydratase domain-containing protein n=1 Tax=Nocardioides humilatus TaxID=2607660 RepID=A0A5B1LMH6_9ACTN|nr:hypothetical protein [Nocardioides humilatus]KAA1421010.1 hypothetical protein F0U44_01365 [Nocardioides humilatus]